MKIHSKSIVLATMLAATAASAQMNMDATKSMGMGKKPEAASSQTHSAKATVKKSDAKTGTVTLDHEPVATLNWPAMTMNFKVRDQALWSRLGEGKKIEVEFVQDGKDYVVTKVK